MSRNNAVRLIALTLALFIVIIGLTVKFKQREEYYKLQIENEYSRAAMQLNSSVNNISLLLKKSSYTQSKDASLKLASEIIAETQLGKNALARLPIGEKGASRLNKFLSQVGNYSVFLSAEKEKGLTKQQKENMKYLSATAQKISEIITDASAKYDNIEYWDNELQNKLPDENLSVSVAAIEDELSDYPTLIYDGPYSDHILEKQPEMTKDAYEVNEQRALEVAKKISGEENLTLGGTSSGHIEGFIFSNENATVSVSRFGGHPIYMRKTRAVEKSIIDYTQALKRAKAFLNESSHMGLIETYYYTDEGVCVISFAFLDGETICYTDLIKVGVAMDTGEIVLYEASGYLTNHKNRTFQSPKYKVEQAKQKLSDELSVKQTSVALIPTDAGEERCYEFLCTTERGEEVLVYISMYDLSEKDILLLLKQDGGVLVK